MAENFEFPIYFDREQFRRDIEQEARRPFSDDPVETAVREFGIRYVVEASPEMRTEDVTQIVREMLHPRFEVEPLFVDYENSPVPERLRPFYLVSVSGVSFDELTQSPYEPAYALLAETPFLSVEPDLPYTQFLGAVAGGVSPKAPVQPVDKAWSLRNIKADKAWMIAPSASGKRDGGGVAVAHLDTGWTDHLDLDSPNFDWSRAMDFITHKGTAEDPLGYRGNTGHGTRTGSVIMSKGGLNTIGTTPPGEITGVARDATYVPVRCIKSVIVITNAEVARAIRYATATACDVLSMSLGGRPMKALQLAVEDAVAKDRLVVCASGNKVGLVVWPARYPATIAVAASNEQDQPWVYTSRGKRIDISAPGEDVWKADPDPMKVASSTGSGTSYATANMAGVAALWLAFHGRAALEALARSNGCNLQEIFRAAVAVTARVPAGWDKSKYGAGIVDAEELLKRPIAAIPLIAAPIAGAGYELNDDGFLKSVSDAFQRGNVWSRKVSYDAFMDAFGHELANAYIDLVDSNEPRDRVPYPSDVFYGVFDGAVRLPKRISKTLARAILRRDN